jgi:hypothetical protein
MSDYTVVYRYPAEDGDFHKKWIASIDYLLSAEKLLEEMKEESPGHLTAPFILTLCAGLEASLNHLFIVDLFRKHGPDRYKKLASTHINAPLKQKIRLVVTVITGHTFRLREESSISNQLDELISTRNKLTHPKDFFSRDEGVPDHIYHSLTVSKCESFFEAVQGFKELFSYQYDDGTIEENELVEEIGPTGEWIPPEEAESTSEDADSE